MVAGAQCELRIDSAVVARAVTDNAGNFSLSAESKSQAALIVSMIGYGKALVEIPSGGRNLQLGNLYLTEGVSLGEVTVTSGRIIDSKGRTLIYPSAADAKASTSAISLFQKLPLPGLEVNPINCTLSVNNGTPVILINGIPSTIDDINSLQPKDIERIEYSQTTPARYADKGNNGLINILLKKRDDGGQFFGWMRDCPYIGFLDANIKASYHQGPSQFTLSYAPSWRDVAKVYDTKTLSYIGYHYANGVTISDIRYIGDKHFLSQTVNADRYEDLVTR